MYMKLAADQRKVCEDVLLEAGLANVMPGTDVRTVANLILFLPSFMAGRGWDLKDGPAQPHISRILIGFLQRGLGLPRGGNSGPIADQLGHRHRGSDEVSAE
jgi:hypothetical protein